jgi:hypothetical protein
MWWEVNAMQDAWVRPNEAAARGGAAPGPRPGDPNWRQRWLAAVRERLRATPERRRELAAARAAQLARDATLWADVRAAEAAYTRGEGERFVPGEATSPEPPPQGHGPHWSHGDHRRGGQR